MIGQYLPNKTKVVLFIELKFFQHLNVAPLLILLACITVDFRTASSVSGRLQQAASKITNSFGTFHNIEIVWTFSPASPLLLFRQALFSPKRKG
jgi:hypothetical protein